MCPITDMSTKSDIEGVNMVFRGETAKKVIIWENLVDKVNVHIRTHMGCKKATCPEYREMSEIVEKARIELLELLSPTN